jgi:hypothetical protein
MMTSNPFCRARGEAAMRKSGVSRLVVGAVLFASASSAWPCSENVFRPGEGAAYRHYAAPLPARVLIYASPGEHGGAALRGTDLENGLADAGHVVTLVTDSRKLARELEDQPYDVVIAGEQDVDAILGALPQDGPTVVPVVGREELKSTAGRQGSNPVLPSDASLRQALKTIHHVMEQRSR